MTAFSKNTYSFPLDVKRRTGVKLLGVNGDTANRFIVTLQDAGVNLDLTGLYVRAVFRRSDGVTVLQSESDSPANITKTTGGVVTINVLNGSFRDGDNEMEIQVLDGDPDTGDVLITSARMLFRVRKELNSDDATESSHEYTVLQQFIDGLGNMTVTVETLAAGSSATAGLTVGDDYSYELALGIPRGADGSDGVGIANIQALESIIDGSYALKIVMTDSTIYTFPLPFYIMPAGGIPLRDLSAGVQASLGKADSALQQHQSLAGYATQTWVGQQGYLTEHQDLSAYRTASDQDVIDDAQDTAIAAKYTKPSGGIPTSDIANGAVTGAKIAAGAVTGAKLAANTVENSNLEYMEPRTVKANNTGGAAAPQDVAFNDMTFVAPRGSGFAGRAGFVPAPTYGDREKFLRGDGSWQTVSGGSDAASIPMGTVDSTSTATAFTATIDGITALRDGVCMWLTNGVITSAEGFTININNLGAKPVYGSLAAATASTTAFGKNYTMLFIFNSSRVTGGCWDLVYGYDTNTTYTPVKLGFGYTTCSTAAATAAKTASLSSYALNTGGIVAVKFTNSVPANATLNINSKGAKAIYYKGAAITAGVIKAGDTVTMMYATQYHVLSIDRDEAPVTSVNGSTGDVTLAAADVGATPETFIVTVTLSNGVYSADKTFAEISTAYAAGKRLMTSFPVPFNGEYINALIPLASVTYGSYAMAFVAVTVMSTATGVMQYQLSIDYSSVLVTEAPLQSRYMTATLTIATSDWNNGSCTKSVTGMTADALVFIRFSDTATDFGYTQAANSMTFTAATAPSESVTVYVAWFKKEVAYDF